MTTNDKTREALPDAAEHVRRLAEDYADACVQAGFVTTIRCEAWHKMSAAIAALTSTPAQPPVAAVPEGWTIVAVNAAFADLMYWLERCDNKGHLENCSDLIEPWAAFQWQAAATPTPAPAAQSEAVGTCEGYADGRPLVRWHGPLRTGTKLYTRAAPERAEVRPPVHADTERLDFIVSKLERDEYGWWLPDWCIKDGEHKPSSCEVRDSIDTRRGITPPSAADSGQGQQQGEA